MKRLEQEIEVEQDRERDFCLAQRKLTIDESVRHVMIEVRDNKPYEAPPASEQRQITYAEAIQEALREEMERDKRVLLMGEDIGVWGNLFNCTRGLLEQFGPERVRDTPISEAGFAGAAVGCAISGLRPIIEIMYIDFISIAMDQIVNHAAKYPQMGRGRVKVPLVVRTQGGVGFRNSSQHSQSLENWFVNVPGLVVVMPATPYDVKGLLKASIRDDNPVIFIEHKAVYRTKGIVPENDYVLPLGKAAVKRPGKDLTIVANSWMAVHALEAARTLAENPTILDYVEQLLGPDFYLWGSQFFSKDPGDGRTVPWHQDAFYWPLSPHKTVTVWLALADSDRDNGGMMVVPGSHRAGRLQHRHSACDSDVLEMTLEEGSFSSADAVCLTLQAGEISMHDDNIVHGSGPNRSARLRCGLTMRYSAGEVKCNTTVWPFFKAFWARGTDRWRHNPRAAPPDRLMTEYIAITPIIGQRL